MSKFQVKVNHIPTNYKEYKISGHELAEKYRELGVEMPFPRSDYWYYHTDREGWATIVPHLVIKSSLYKPDRFDCEDYALKAQGLCAELFGLNTLRYTYGSMPLGAHGFCSFWTGDDFLLFEPNDAFWDHLNGNLVFEWRENGYEPKAVLL